MAPTQPPPTKRRPRWRFQFTLGWLLGLMVVANLYFAYFLYEPAKWDHVRVHVAADAIFVGSEKVSLKALPHRLEQFGRRSRSTDVAIVPLSNIRVVLTVDDEAAYGKFKRVAEQCWDSSVRILELKISDRVGSFNVRGRSWVAPSSIEPGIPPYYVEVHADKLGDFVRIDTPLGTNRTLDQFRAEVLEFVGPGRGPGSIRDIAEFEIHCDDHLKFKHVRAVLEAITEHPRPGGPRVPVIRTVQLDPLPEETDATLSGPPVGCSPGGPPFTLPPGPTMPPVIVNWPKIAPVVKQPVSPMTRTADER